MRYILLCLLCFALLLTQCKSNLAQSSRTYDSLVSVKVGKPFDSISNHAKTYSLVYSKDPENTALDYKYAVISLKDNEVVLEGTYNHGGYVKWINDTMIEVLTIPKNVKVVNDSSLYKREIYLEGIK